MMNCEFSKEALFATQPKFLLLNFLGVFSGEKAFSSNFLEFVALDRLLSKSITHHIAYLLQNAEVLTMVGC